MNILRSQNKWGTRLPALQSGKNSIQDNGLGREGFSFVASEDGASLMIPKASCCMESCLSQLTVPQGHLWDRSGSFILPHPL